MCWCAVRKPLTHSIWHLSGADAPMLCSAKQMYYTMCHLKHSSWNCPDVDNQMQWLHTFGPLCIYYTTRTRTTMCIKLHGISTETWPYISPYGNATSTYNTMNNTHIVVLAYAFLTNRNTTSYVCKRTGCATGTVSICKQRFWPGG